MKLAAFTLGMIILCFTPVRVQPVRSEILRAWIFNAPPPPDDINAPGNRVGGGKRGCENVQKQPTSSEEKLLTALAPIYKFSDAGLVLGLTTTSHPTFWFYIPDVTIVAAEFVLQNETGKTVSQSPVALAGTPGVISLALGSTTSPLEIGKRYHWYFNIYCNLQQPPVFVDGWIKRVETNPTLKSQLETATPKQRIAVYATHGIWYEALTAAAELRHIDPKRTDWVDLLQAVGLNDITSEPVVECCQYL